MLTFEEFRTELHNRVSMSSPCAPSVISKAEKYEDLVGYLRENWAFAATNNIISAAFLNEAVPEEILHKFGIYTTGKIADDSLADYFLCGDASLTVRRFHHVYLMENAKLEGPIFELEVFAYGSSQIICHRSKVTLHDHACLSGSGNIIEANDFSSVKAKGKSTIVAKDSAEVQVQDTGTVDARGHASIIAYGQAKVQATETALVTASDNALVECRDHAKAWGHNHAIIMDYAGLSSEVTEQAIIVDCLHNSIIVSNTVNVKVCGK